MWRIAYPPLGQADFNFAVQQIRTWEFVRRDDDAHGAAAHCGDCRSHLIGRSEDGLVWAFVALGHAPPEALGEDAAAIMAAQHGREFMVFNPPRQNSVWISSLFFALHDVLHAEGDFDSDQVDEIYQQFRVEAGQPMSTFFPEAPESWLGGKGFIDYESRLSDRGFVSDETIRAFECHSVDEVLMAVCSSRTWAITVSYEIRASRIDERMSWEVDAPLSRRGSNEPERGCSVYGLRLYQDVPQVGFVGEPDVDSQPTVRLCVGGPSKAKAIENWERCAKALRKRKRRLEIPKGSPVDWQVDETGRVRAEERPVLRLRLPSGRTLRPAGVPVWEGLAEIGGAIGRESVDEDG